MKKRLIWVFSLIAIISNPSIAGSAQHEESKFLLSELEIFAKSVENFAASEGANVFIIGRVGRPEKDLPKGIHFTHSAIAIYSSITLDSGEKVKGYAIHNLYQRANESDKSELMIDYPVDFFAGASVLKAGIIIPTPELQLRIIEVIATGKDKLIHNENYSVIANPFNNVFQNCTEHTLNVINSAIYQTTDIGQLKANAKQYFIPQRVKVNPFKLILGDWFVDEVSTQDHSGNINTATFTTIAHYLNNNKLISKAIVLDNHGSVAKIL